MSNSVALDTGPISTPSQPTVTLKKKSSTKKKNKPPAPKPDLDEFDLILQEAKSSSAPARDTARPSSKEEDNTEPSSLRCVGAWPETNSETCIDPPGEVVEYTSYNHVGDTPSEIAHRNNFYVATELVHYRQAAECHRQTRKYVQSFLRPGLKLVDVCERLETHVKQFLNSTDNLVCGHGFPTGCSLNHVAAHYTPNTGDSTILKASDVMKLDFGVHVKGRIIDCAFTVAFDPKYDPLIQATIDGTNTGLKYAGVDVPFSDIGSAIQEVIESYEVELDQKIYPVKVIRNLQGHSIEPYIIHGKKSVPIRKNDETTRMEEGEVYAIETFASTGKGHVVPTDECSHYMRHPDVTRAPLRSRQSKQLLYVINKSFDTLAFCRRWLDDLGQTRHLLALKSLVDSHLVEEYPPLADVRGSFTSQMEHTVFLGPTAKEILSRGLDY